jgi:hypothetical protein
MKRQKETRVSEWIAIGKSRDHRANSKASQQDQKGDPELAR